MTQKLWELNSLRIKQKIHVVNWIQIHKDLNCLMHILSEFNSPFHIEQEAI